MKSSSSSYVTLLQIRICIHPAVLIERARDENWIQRGTFLILACLDKVPRDRQASRSLSSYRSARQEMGLALRDQPRSGNEIRPARCARSKPEKGATTLDTGTTAGDISWCPASYVRTRYKFTLCFYHDCYYFLIKRYCAVPRPCSREQMMWNDELTRPCASYCSTFAPQCSFLPATIVTIRLFYSSTREASATRSTTAGAAGRMLRASNTM